MAHGGHAVGPWWPVASAHGQEDPRGRAPAAQEAPSRGCLPDRGPELRSGRRRPHAGPQSLAHPRRDRRGRAPGHCPRGHALGAKDRRTCRGPALTPGAAHPEGGQAGPVRERPSGSRSDGPAGSARRRARWGCRSAAARGRRTATPRSRGLSAMRRRFPSRSDGPGGREGAGGGPRRPGWRFRRRPPRPPPGRAPAATHPASAPPATDDAAPGAARVELPARRPRTSRERVRASGARSPTAAANRRAAPRRDRAATGAASRSSVAAADTSGSAATRSGARAAGR